MPRDVFKWGQSVGAKRMSSCSPMARRLHREMGMLVEKSNWAFGSAFWALFDGG